MDKKHGLSGLFILLFLVVSITCQKKKEYDKSMFVDTIKDDQVKLANAKNSLDLFEVDHEIQLESKENGMIGRIAKVVYFNGYYFISDKHYAKKVFMFDTNGRFVKIVGQNGVNYQEYEEPTDINIIDSTIGVLSYGAISKLLFFDKNGEFLKEVTLSKNEIGKELRPNRFWYSKKCQNYYCHCFIPPMLESVHSKNEYNRIFVLNNNYKVENSFGEFEKENIQYLLDETMYSTMDSLDNLWIGNYFYSTINVFNCQGRLMKEVDLAEGEKNMLTTKKYFRKDVNPTMDQIQKLEQNSRYISLVQNINNKYIYIEISGDRKDTHALLYSMSGELLNNKIEIISIAGAWFDKCIGCANGKLIFSMEDDFGKDGKLPNPKLVFLSSKI